MSALTPTLVVVVNNRRDWWRVRDEGWYRIPLKHAPHPVAAEYLAFYFTRRFGRQAWQVPCYAPVRRYALLQRRLLLPHQEDHPRADDWYYRVELGPVEHLPQPLVSRRLRRVTFIPTTLERLLAADDVAELWQIDEESAVLWRYFPDLALKTTKRLFVEERRDRYRTSRLSDTHPSIRRVSVTGFGLPCG